MTGFSSWFRSGIGSFSRVGGVGSVGGGPVLENAPDFCMNSVSAFMPLGVPSISGRVTSADAFLRISLWWLYLGQSLMMCSLVSGVSLSQGHVVGSGARGKKVRRNSPVYACPVLHCTSRPNVSRFSFRFARCLVGFREGCILFAIANLPDFGVFFQSFTHIFSVVDLIRRFAFDRVVLNGIWQLSLVAAFARVSALSLPGMSQWLGHHDTEIIRFG